MHTLRPFFVLFLALSATSVAVRPLAGQSRYTIVGNESEVTYAMEHPAHHWTGTSHAAAGFVRLDEAQHPVEIRVTIPVLSFDSGNRNRDSHMAEAVESYLYRDVSFHSTSITEAPAGPDGILHWKVAGELTLHGVPEPVEIDVTVQLSKGDLVAEGAFEVVLTAFEIELPSLLMVKVKDWIRISFHLVSTPGYS